MAVRRRAHGWESRQRNVSHHSLQVCDAPCEGVRALCDKPGETNENYLASTEQTVSCRKRWRAHQSRKKMANRTIRSLFNGPMRKKESFSLEIFDIPFWERGTIIAGFSLSGSAGRSGSLR